MLIKQKSFKNLQASPVMKYGKACLYDYIDVAFSFPSVDDV